MGWCSTSDVAGEQKKEEDSEVIGDRGCDPWFSLVTGIVHCCSSIILLSLIHLFRFRPQYSIHCVNLSGNYWAIDQCSDSIGFPRLVGWEEEQTFHSSILYQGSRTSEGSWFAINSILFLVLVRCPRINCTFINSAVAARPEPQTFD